MQRLSPIILNKPKTGTPGLCVVFVSHLIFSCLCSVSKNNLHQHSDIVFELWISVFLHQVLFVQRLCSIFHDGSKMFFSPKAFLWEKNSHCEVILAQTPYYLFYFNLFSVDVDSEVQGSSGIRCQLTQIFSEHIYFILCNMRVRKRQGIISCVLADSCIIRTKIIHLHGTR